MPTSASLMQIGSRDATAICREVLRVLQGVTVDDLVTFEKVDYLLSAKGYKENHYAEITAELVDIIRLRGLYARQERWRPTLDVVFTSYEAFHGIVTPHDVEDFLSSAGPMAKTLSDDGLTDMIIMIKHQRQRGD